MQEIKAPTTPPPRGFEWLPDAYERDIEPKGNDARESARQALAEGEIKAILRQPTGDVYPVWPRMWAKEKLEEIVWRYFEDGWMRMSLADKPIPRNQLVYVKGWVFVPEKCFTKLLAPRGKRGRKATHPWPELIKVVLEKLMDDAWPSVEHGEDDWKTEEDLIRFMASCCLDLWGKQPARSTLQLRIPALRTAYDEYKTDLADN